ncbi:tRNA (guanosine(37)-N1)-methyltransferase TrmD [Sphingorhabdus sp. SMR4y]|uniref:tRNA (guanosine(37)-N1)-methyltransferase TrmD n=1 Tax=Sphingorhabdus sp. SMR4y TaxID=2584094 RepID=UPI000B5C5D37|nr:tRNA (guanosine(37)-N1)-methyltransferase TrmD [Sphingorhabdus sp. SMR4y]
MTFNAQILTLYPDMFPGPLGTSLAGRALTEGKWALDTINPRDFATDRHRSVDDTPAGGGAGMVLRVDVMAAAVDHAVERMKQKVAAQNSVRPEPVEGPGFRAARTSTNSAGTAGRAPAVPILAMTPRGKPLTQARIREIVSGPGVTIICGRFEGFDERLLEGRPIEEISIGDYVLSGGEMGALVLLDACIRLLPGVMGASSSGDDESFEHGILEYPQYTRPQIWEGRIIPEVLRSGDHAKIAAWRKQRAEEDTRLRRPDLWERHRDAPDQSPSGAQEKDKDKE